MELQSMKFLPRRNRRWLENNWIFESKRALERAMPSKNVWKETRLRAYYIKARPVFLYGSEVWNLEKITKKRIRSMRATVEYPRQGRKWNIDILEELQVEQIIERIKSYRRNWRCIRMNDPRKEYWIIHRQEEEVEEDRWKDYWTRCLAVPKAQIQRKAALPMLFISFMMKNCRLSENVIIIFLNEKSHLVKEHQNPTNPTPIR